MSLASSTGLFRLTAALAASLFAIALPLSPAVAATVRWEKPVELATGPGERGPWQQNESRFRYVDDGAVSAGPDGSMFVAWVDQTRKDVLFRKLDERSQASGETVNVSRSPDSFSWLPRILAVPAQPDLVIVAWQEIIFAGGAHGGDILVARSTDGGTSFAEPINVSHSIGGDGKGRITKEIWHNGSMDIAAGPEGDIHLAWTEYDGQLWHSRSRDGGASWTEPRHVAGTRAIPARAPALAADRNGTVYLAWTTGEHRSADIMLAFSTDRGASFTRARTVEKSPGYSDAPRLAVDRSGTLHLAWSESDGGPFDRARIRYAKSRDRGASWGGIKTIAAANGAGSASFPYLALGPGGQVLLAWEQFERAGTRSRGLGFVVSADAGKRFSKPDVVPGSVDPEGRMNGSFQGLLMQKLAVAGNGRIAVVNSALRDDHSSRVWLIPGWLR